MATDKRLSSLEVLFKALADRTRLRILALLQAGELAQHYARRAQEWNTGFFDASTVAKPDPLDGIHLDAANTRAIGEGLVPVVKSMLSL